MKREFKFEKILTLKEREKQEALDVYNQSVKKFEEALEQLYELLKKKEDLEDYQSSRLMKGIPVQEMKYYQGFIQNLEKSIKTYQQIVANVRSQMQFYQEKLKEKNIEVKKFEKMKDRDFILFTEQVKQLEDRQMDDISIQHFMYRGN
jgi:flagellar protein FliJ